MAQKRLVQPQEALLAQEKIPGDEFRGKRKEQCRGFEMKRASMFDMFWEREISCPSDSFRRRVKRSHGLVQGIRMTHFLEHHGGCVNTVAWHPNGAELLSSGDDLQLCVWDAESWSVKGSYRTGHTRNVFCVQYVPGQEGRTCVTAAADGDVRLIDLVQQENGNIVARVDLLSSMLGDMTLKIEFLPLAPSSFLTTHQDGTIRLTDLRDARNLLPGQHAPEQIVVELRQNMFYSVSFDPTNPNTFAATTGNHFVRLYDLRMAGRPYDAGEHTGSCVKVWTDPHLLPPDAKVRPKDLVRQSRRHVTDAHFGRTGNLLCNFSGHDVVLFGAEDGTMLEGNVCVNVAQRFEGRRNVETFLKEVRFFGDEAFVCTGSDSGEVFFWETDTGELVHKIVADRLVVNGVAPHPWLPMMATCGIDSDVKILEYRGGRGMPETDPIIHAGEFGPQMLSFRARARSGPELVLSDRVGPLMESAEQFRNAGNEHFRSKNFDAAINHYNHTLDVLRFCPPNPEERMARDELRLLMFQNLSACYLATKDFRSAEKCATRALKIQPKSVKALYRRAKAHIGQGEIEAAVEDAKSGLGFARDEEDIVAFRKLLEHCKGSGKKKRPSSDQQDEQEEEEEQE